MLFFSSPLCSPHQFVCQFWILPSFLVNLFVFRMLYDQTMMVHGHTLISLLGLGLCSSSGLCLCWCPVSQSILFWFNLYYFRWSILILSSSPSSFWPMFLQYRCLGLRRSPLDEHNSCLPHGEFPLRSLLFLRYLN